VSGRDTYNHDDPDASEYGHVHPEKPPPAFLQGNVSRNNQRHGRSERGTQAINRHCISAGVSLPDVTDGSTGVREWSRTSEALDQSADYHSTDIGRQSEWKLEDEQDEP